MKERRKDKRKIGYKEGKEKEEKGETDERYVSGDE